MEFQVIKAPKRKLDWKGLQVRSTKEVVTGAVVMPPGSLGVIQYSANGHTLIHFDACPCCGIAARVVWKHLDGPTSFEFVAPVKRDLLTGEAA